MDIKACMATYKNRRSVVGDAIESLRYQVDLCVYCNDYESYEYVRSLGVMAIHGTDIGDMGKFACPQGDITLTVDDDLIYPDDYVERTIDNFISPVVSYHGKTIVDGRIKDNYRVLDGTPNARVDMPGTGCMTFNVNIAPDHRFINKADAYIYYLGLDCMVLKSKKGWIRYNEKMLGKETIAQTYNIHNVIKETWQMKSQQN